jgi:hypothetical protein
MRISPQLLHWTRLWACRASWARRRSRRLDECLRFGCGGILLNSSRLLRRSASVLRSLFKTGPAWGVKCINRMPAGWAGWGIIRSCGRYVKGNTALSGICLKDINTLVGIQQAELTTFRQQAGGKRAASPPKEDISDPLFVHQSCQLVWVGAVFYHRLCCS